jgi:Flavodoxin
MTTVIVYASKTGNTKAIAAYIASKLSCDIVEIGKNDVNIAGYDRIIIGSGVYAGRLSKAVRNFLAEKDFNGKDVSFFLTCKLKDEKGEEQLKKLTASYSFVSSKTFFSGKKKGSEANDAADVFIQSL